jgi:hypothetical protein
MADYFDYNDSVRTFLVSMSLDAINEGFEGTTVGYGIKLQYSGSSDKSLDGAYALWDENIQFTGTASLFLTIPTASYLDPRSTTSSSIASFINKYTRVPLSGSGNNSLDTQILLEAGSPTVMACNSSCYQGELPWYNIDGTGPYPATVQNPITRNRIRPIKGGISITSTSHSTPFTTGEPDTTVTEPDICCVLDLFTHHNVCPSNSIVVKISCSLMIDGELKYCEAEFSAIAEIILLACSTSSWVIISTPSVKDDLKLSQVSLPTLVRLSQTGATAKRALTVAGSSNIA